MNALADQDGVLLAVRYLRKQVRAARNKWDGASTGEDIECIHDVRVASRRLRAALKVLRPYLPDKEVRRWRREVKRLTCGLGKARDKDVKIEFLRTFLDSLTDRTARPGVARLLLRLEQSRWALHDKVHAALRRADESGAWGEMREYAKAALAEAGEEDRRPASAATVRWCGERIAPRLEKMLERQAHLANAEARQEHHEMRIAAKRLRYTMEIFAPAYEGRLSSAVTVIKRVQTLLGDIHDCDVWDEFLDEFRETEHVRTLEYFGHGRYFKRLVPGIEFLRADRLTHRRDLFGQLQDLWQELASRSYWDKLADVAAGGQDALPPAESILPGSAKDVAADPAPASEVPAGEALASEETPLPASPPAHDQPGMDAPA